MRLSNTTRTLGASPTLAISAKAKQLKSEGLEVLDLSLGEPDFPTPTPIREAAKKAIDDGWTQYTPVAGMMELRTRISEFLRDRRQLDYAPEQIVVSTGAKQCLYNCIVSLIDRGDEVIIPSPYWVSYPTQVSIAGGRSVFVETHLEDNFQIAPDAIEKAITPYTRMILLNSPNNPTGAVYEPERLKAIAKIAAEKDLWLLSDEMYDELVYEGAVAHSPLQLWEPVRKKAILINGFSKAYAMTGWRLGFMAAPAPLVRAVIALQGASTSGTNSIAQRAGLAALELDPALLEEMRLTFQERLRFLKKRCETLPDVQSSQPQGAFYLMLDFTKHLGKTTPKGIHIDSTLTLAKYLLEEGLVALVPGEAFGVPGQMRISYAVDTELLGRAIERISLALQQLT